MLHNLISIGEDKALLSANPFATAIGKSGLLPLAKGNKYEEDGIDSYLYNIKNHDHSTEMNSARVAMVKFISFCYEYVEEYYGDIYQNEQYVLSNRGTYAFICLLGSLNKHETLCGNLNVTSTPIQRFEAIEGYLKVLLEKLKKLSNQEKEAILNKLGSGADTAWLRSYQTYIHQVFKNYNPPELIDWRERQDEQLQARGRKLGTKIERFLKNRMIKKMNQLFGDEWDLHIASIQRECAKRAAEEIENQFKQGLGRKEIPWTDMFYITDYKTIIEKFWTKQPNEEINGFTTFEQDFSIDIGSGFSSKSDKTKWISVFNSYRNLWAQEGTKEKRLNREEVGFLLSIFENLGI